jgi:hypothetical protein
LHLADGKIDRRAGDGYINLTQFFKAAGKEYKEWREDEKTKEYLLLVSAQTGLPVNKLVGYTYSYS